MFFQDRTDAGMQLAEKLQAYKGQKDALVIGLARGGVVTAAPIAKALHLPLNVLVVRKIGAPGNPELAIGAITQNGDGVWNEHLIASLGVSKQYIQQEVAKEMALAKKRVALYHKNCPLIDVKGKTVLLVDDGIATGASMRAAIQSLRASSVKKIVLAIPVAAPDSLYEIQKTVDETVCLYHPPFFAAVGQFYRVFDQTSEEEIISILSYTNRNK